MLRTPFLLACKGGHFEVAKWLFECKSSDPHHKDQVQWLLCDWLSDNRLFVCYLRVYL